MSPGITVVIPCHNSASRIAPTLTHLAAQSGYEKPWEVILVDNCCTDDTVSRAKALWEPRAPAQLRVLREDTPGSAHARMRGLSQATFDLVALVDDDNWLCERWLAVADEVMRAHPQVGACGSRGEPVAETPLPPWFQFAQAMYAVGPQAPCAGDCTETARTLWSAGLIIRKAAWNMLLENNYRFRLPGRAGTSLAAGEDVELSLVLRLCGWRLWYDSRLSYKHYLPPRRLSWPYVRELYRQIGWTSVATEPLRLSLPDPRFRRHLNRYWLVRLASSAVRASSHRILAALPRFGKPRHRSVLQADYWAERTRALIRTGPGWTAAGGGGLAPFASS